MRPDFLRGGIGRATEVRSWGLTARHIFALRTVFLSFCIRFCGRAPVRMNPSTAENANPWGRDLSGRVNQPMETLPADIHRLTLLIQRILDAEVLFDTAGAALLT